MYTKKLPFQNTFEKYNRPVKYKKKSRTPKTYKNDTRQIPGKDQDTAKKPERPWAMSNAQHPGPRPPAPDLRPPGPPGSRLLPASMRSMPKRASHCNSLLIQ